MIIECTKECLLFIVVLAVLVSGFALATYYRQILLHEEGDESLPFSEHGYNTIMTALGDFGAQTETLESFTLFIIFFLACLIILIVMMNLLIGMISERLAEVLEQKEINDNFELCQLISDLENIMFWKRGKENKDS
jgi:ABC-type transport system involved in multi-copper enzyme maturation permease subunit